MKISSLKSKQLSEAKTAYTTRNIDSLEISTILSGNLKPQVGDLVLARVDKIGYQKRIELPSGRKAHLFSGDEIIVCYGNRYAPDQFEAEIPPDLSPCHLVAAGGVAGLVLSQHRNIDNATIITPIGLLGNQEGHRLNLAQTVSLNINSNSYISQIPKTIVVVGSSMNSGKTTTAAHLIKGLVQTGYRVGAAKLTGTGAGNDIWKMRDAGAKPVLDFTDVGFPSTYKISPTAVERIALGLINHLALNPVEALVLEIADGLYQKETAQLLSSPAFQQVIDGVVYACNSSLGATAGVELLRRYNLPVLAISGIITSSPLAAREAARVNRLPVLGMNQLSIQAPVLISQLSKTELLPQQVTSQLFKSKEVSKLVVPVHN